MKIIVNDANILIDLVDLKILPYFFQLEFEFHTTTVILDELFEEQREALFPYIETGSLIVDDISNQDLKGIGSISPNIPGTSSNLPLYSNFISSLSLSIPVLKSTRTLSISMYTIFFISLVVSTLKIS